MNLRWLDLSFNLIEKIEGLENNKELEDLSLYSNCITELSGLDELNKLNVLSVGRNKIDKLDNMLNYLKKLKNRLQVLKIEENPFKNEEKSNKDSLSRNKAIAYLKDLKYLDYRIISDEERQAANDEMKEQLTDTQVEDNANDTTDESKLNYAALKEAMIEIT